MTTEHTNLIARLRRYADVEAADAIAALVAERDASVEALRELVACNDLHDEETRMRQRRECRRLRGSEEARRTVNAMRSDYNRRKPLAWAAARAILAAAQEQKP